MNAELVNLIKKAVEDSYENFKESLIEESYTSFEGSTPIALLNGRYLYLSFCFDSNNSLLDIIGSEPIVYNEVMYKRKQPDIGDSFIFPEDLEIFYDLETKEIVITDKGDIKYSEIDLFNIEDDNDNYIIVKINNDSFKMIY